MAGPKITLYLLPDACSLFPHILLHEQGFDAFETIAVTERSVIEDPEFARTNPKKQVPVLCIDDWVVTENPAIAHAIQSLRPENNIMGRDAKESVRVCEWLNWISASFHGQAWGPYLRPRRFTTDSDGEAAVKAKALEKLRERFAMIEGWLSEGDGWAVGRGFSAVDVYLLPYFRWAAKREEFDVKASCPRYAALMERVEARAAVQRALKRETEIKEKMDGR